MFHPFICNWKKRVFCWNIGCVCSLLLFLFFFSFIFDFTVLISVKLQCVSPGISTPLLWLSLSVIIAFQIAGVLPCATCGEPFSDPVSLREHRLKEHPQDKSYQCMFCNTTFVKHSHLVVHTRIHTGSRPYICGQCGNRFPKSSDLKRHARVHSGK